MFHKNLKELRTFLYDAYWPPFAPELAYDPAYGIELCKKAGANAIRFGSIGKYAMYPSRIIPHHPKLDGRNLLQETIEIGEKEGIKVIGYIPVGHALPGSWLRKLKPEWIFRDKRGNVVSPGEQNRHFGGEPLLSVCSFGAYRRDIIEVVNEITGHDVYAAYLDGPCQGWGAEDKICQCEACQTRYKSETGGELPDIGDDRERLKDYLEWGRKNLFDLLREIREIAEKKNLLLMMNRTPALLCGSRCEVEMLKLTDCFLIESERGGIEGASVAQALGRDIWNYTNRHTWHPRLSNPDSERHSLHQGRLTLSLGGIPIVSYAGRFFNSDKHIENIARLFEDSKKCLKITGGNVSMSRFACVFRNSSEREFVTPGVDGVEINDDAINIAESLNSVGIPVAVLPDLFMDDAKLVNSFKALFITGQAILNPERIEMLRKFSHDGGTVVFTGIAPPGFSGVAEATPDSRLRTALTTQYWCGKRYDCYLRAPGFDLLPQAESSMFKSAGAEVVAESVIFDLDGEITYPSVFKHKAGKGNCIVFDSPLEKFISAANNDIDRFFRLVCLENTEIPVLLRDANIPVSVSLLENGARQFVYVVASGAGRIKLTTGSGKKAKTNFGGSLTGDGRNLILSFNEFEVITLEQEG